MITPYEYSIRHTRESRAPAKNAAYEAAYLILAHATSDQAKAEAAAESCAKSAISRTPDPEQAVSLATSNANLVIEMGFI